MSEIRRGQDGVSSLNSSGDYTKNGHNERATARGQFKLKKPSTNYSTDYMSYFDIVRSQTENSIKALSLEVHH